MSGELQVEPFQLCGTPLGSAYTALTASQRLIVTVEGEKRYGVTIWMVVVGPGVVQVDVRVAVFVAAGVGLGVEAALVAAAVVAAVGLGRRLVGEAAGDGLPEAAIVADAPVVEMPNAFVFGLREATVELTPR